MTNKYQLVLIVTCINDTYIKNMINSVLENNHTIKTLILFINQSEQIYEFKSIKNERVEIRQIKSNKISSSKARNVGVQYILDNDIQFFHIMFPDDDSTYSDVFFKQYTRTIESDSNYLIDIYCLDSEILYKRINHLDGDVLSRKNYESVMSVNMIINFKTFLLVGLLDERLGAGAKYGGGEDVDYFIRSCDHSKNGFLYKKNIFCYHPSPQDRYSKMSFDKIISRFINYGNGTVFMLCKHNLHSKALLVCFRAVGGAFKSLIKFDLKVFIAFSIAFFSRIIMLGKCILFARKYYR